MSIKKISTTVLLVMFAGLLACEEPCDHANHDTGDVGCEPGESECVCEPSEPYPSCDNPLYACVDDVCVSCNPGTLDCECTGGDGVTCIELGLTCVEGKCRA